MRKKMFKKFYDCCQILFNVYLLLFLSLKKNIFKIRKTIFYFKFIFSKNYFKFLSFFG